jgi:hypothetical protein
MVRPHLADNSVVILDNFDAHVTPESHACVKDAYNSKLCLLPPNCTHVCQPLDVGVMGPFKAILRSKWLLESVDELLDENGNIRDCSVSSRTAASKRIATIKHAIDAWGEISEDLIRKSFDKALLRPHSSVVLEQISL